MKNAIRIGRIVWCLAAMSASASARIVDAQAAVPQTRATTPSDRPMPQSSDIDGGWSASLSLGTYHTTRRDESASPFRFGGRGAIVLAGIERQTAHYRIVLDGQGGSFGLASLATDTDVQLITGSAGVGVLRRFRTSRSLQFDAGLALRANADITEHSFALTSVADTKFRFATLAIAPDVRATSVQSWGTLRLQVTSPLVGWVDHPYSAVKSASNGYRARFATVSKLRRADVDVSWMSPSRYHMRAMLGLRASAVNYLDEQPVRAVTNSISAGVILGRGGFAR